MVLKDKIIGFHIEWYIIIDQSTDAIPQFTYRVHIFRAALWFVPLEPSTQRHIISSTLPFCSAWSALDVFFVASIAAYMEMNLLTDFIVQKRFGALCSDILEVYGVPCVRLQHKIKWGGMLLLGTATLSIVLFSRIIGNLGDVMMEASREDLISDETGEDGVNTSCTLVYQEEGEEEGLPSMRTSRTT
jgi:hypothetical protein